MSLLRLFSITFLLICITFGTMIGCEDEENNGGSSNDGGELSGELNCTDGIDNDGDSQVDCADIDCILDPECSDDDNTPPVEPPVDDTPETPILNEPINNQTITQNNPDIGCPFSSFSGFGFEIFFDWSDSESLNGIEGYNLFVIGPEPAIFPIVDAFVTESEFTFTSCNSFVIDSNLEGWEWNVQAVGTNGQVTKIEKLSEVSETQTFQFEPCRFQDGTGCGGQPPTEPTSGDDDDMIPPPSACPSGQKECSVAPGGCIANSSVCCEDGGGFNGECFTAEFPHCVSVGCCDAGFPFICPGNQSCTSDPSLSDCPGATPPPPSACPSGQKECSVAPGGCISNISVCCEDGGGINGECKFTGFPHCVFNACCPTGSPFLCPDNQHCSFDPNLSNCP